jgi:hypothetical protein
MTRTAMARTGLRIALLDAAILTAVALAPGAAHALAFPLYLFEPMRIGLFAALVYAGRTNGLALAVAMPLLAFATSGHPVPPKLFLIQAELAANVWLFHLLLGRARSRTWTFAAAAAVSVAASKALYYGLKYALIQAGALDGALVSTPWRHQIAVLLLVALAGQVAWSARRRRGGSDPASAAPGPRRTGPR